MVQEGHCVASQVTLELTLHIAFLPRKSDQNQSKELAFYNMVIGCVCEKKRQRDRKRHRERERDRENPQWGSERKTLLFGNNDKRTSTERSQSFP